MIRAVLDANQFVSALLKPVSHPARILDLAEEGKVELLVSNGILSEIRRVLLYPKLVKVHGLSAKQIDAFLESFWKIATVTPGKLRVQAVEKDPTDNKYIECALEGEADYIVSGDRHLLDLKTFQGIKIVNPAAFLRNVDEGQALE
ncbi:MAG: putative toxin-antitoxin system toxin component, PIN family [Nitrospinae bacterium]|nr:putative toxin-antitoxin system toxin component, PIN family [Nitrospinota bacterium]